MLDLPTLDFQLGTVCNAPPSHSCVVSAVDSPEDLHDQHHGKVMWVNHVAIVVSFMIFVA